MVVLEELDHEEEVAPVRSASGPSRHARNTGDLDERPRRAAAEGYNRQH
jgi:hypothetical protein